MKTTVEIPDLSAEEARAVAQRDRTALRELVETGLRLGLRERHRKTRFKLRDASFRGLGLEYHEEDWHRVRIWSDRCQEPLPFVRELGWTGRDRFDDESL